LAAHDPADFGGFLPCATDHAGRCGDCTAKTEGDGIIAKKKNPHIRDEVAVAAIKSVIAHQLASEMNPKDGSLS
jgi:hypothetical protein